MSASQELAGLGGDVLFFKNNLVNQNYPESELNNNMCCPILTLNVGINTALRWLFAQEKYNLI